MKKSVEKGITLIALVVTIVVLLILAGISISMLTEENGVITQARKSKDETIIGDEKEGISEATFSAASLQTIPFFNDKIYTKFTKTALT